MANTPSAKKSLRQTKKSNARNSAVKSLVKTAVKNVRLAVSKNEDATALLSQAFRVIDKAKSKGILKKNTASRKKSRLAYLVHTSAKA